MDPEAFLDMANQVIKLKMFPYFDIAHCVLCALHVREDLGSGKPNSHSFSLSLSLLAYPAHSKFKAARAFIALDRRVSPGIVACPSSSIHIFKSFIFLR